MGGNVLVTAPGHGTVAGYNVGAAYLFDAATGALVRTFAHPEPLEGSFFGFTAARVGPNVLISAPPINKAYVFEAATGTLLHTFTHPDPVGSDFYGQALASRGGDVVIGAQLDSAAGAFTGAVYQYAPALCPPTPAVGCRAPSAQAARVRIKGDPSGDRDRLVWKYRGVGTIVPDIGSPADTTTYALCIYDASASPQPLMTPRAPGGGMCGLRPCWTALGNAGYRYRDALLTPDGLNVGRLRVAFSYGTLTAALSFKGKGDGLGVPGLPLTPPVVVQVQNTETAACWESRFTTPILNDATIFKAKSD